MNNSILTGVVRGNVIELDRDSGLPDGQRVAVTVHPTAPAQTGEGLRAAFGAWAGDDETEWREFMERLRHDRQQDRAEPAD